MNTNNTEISETFTNQEKPKRKQNVLERQTFSFQNKHTRAIKENKTCLSDDENLNDNPLELNPLGTYKTIANRL